MNREMKWIALLAFALMIAGSFVACGDDATSTTAPSVASADAAVTGLASTRSHGGGDDDSDDASDDVSDDDSSDDDSSDDDSSGGSSGPSGDADRARGLFFGIEGCPAGSDCVLAVRIKDTLVFVTGETRVDNEPALVEDLPPSELAALLADRFGLPLRARGVTNGDGLVASRFRIDDEIRATGEVVAPAMGCVGDMGLLVSLTFPPLCFDLSGLGAPAVGSTVRVEGIVPADLMSPYRAVEIEPID